MINLSVNVNKVATLRNSRGGREPDVCEAVAVCLAAGAPGITVHPRADRRHITPDDVRAIAGLLRERAPSVEYNIEGDPRPELLDLVDEVGPAQCTLVPVAPGEVTSQAGWGAGADADRISGQSARLAGREGAPGPPGTGSRARSRVCARAAFASVCSSMPRTSRSAGRGRPARTG